MYAVEWMNDSIHKHWGLPEFYCRKWDNYYIVNSKCWKQVYQNWVIGLLCIPNLQVWEHNYYPHVLSYFVFFFIYISFFVCVCLFSNLFVAFYIQRKSKLQLALENQRESKGYYWWTHWGSPQFCSFSTQPMPHLHGDCGDFHFHTWFWCIFPAQNSLLHDF